MRLFIFLVCCVLLCSCGEDEPEINKPTACSPSSFADYNQYDIIADDCFVSVVEDSFDEQTNYFEIGLIDDSDVYLENGKLIIENEEGQSVVRCVECGFHKVDNFQIDLDFTIDDFSSENNSVKIAWGGDPNDVLEKSFRIGVNCYPRYQRFENEGRWQFGTGYTNTSANDYINWPGSNRLTIRNVLPETFFFLNGEFVGLVDRAVLDNHRDIALILSGAIDLSIEHFQYREIIR